MVLIWLNFGLHFCMAESLDASLVFVRIQLLPASSCALRHTSPHSYKPPSALQDHNVNPQFHNEPVVLPADTDAVRRAIFDRIEANRELTV